MFTADNLKSFLCFSSFVSVSSSFFFNYSIATDLLTPTTPLTDGQTLVSSGDKFELGFFSPSSSNSRYLGIWYKQSPKTVVWVANRNYPVIGSGGVLRIGDGGQLILMNQTQHVLWSSNSSKLGQDPRAQLLDVGNFVVMDGRNSISSTSGSYLWESFDHPTDTTLPGSRIGRDLGQGPDIFLTSWKSPSDPSPGDFLYRFKYRGLSELVIYQGSVKTFRSGPWNGVAFSGVSPPNKFGSFIMNFHDNVLYNFYLIRTYNNTDTTTRIVLTPSGSVDWLMLDEGTNQWKLLHTSPGDLCQNYGRCGINSICRVSKGFVCDCLKGFTPKVEQKWDLLDWSDGCVRKVALNCSDQDRFFKLVDVKLPELVEFRLDTSMDLQQCRAVCLKDCSCSAYANSNITQGGSCCVLWYGDLIDIMEFNQEGGEQAIFIRLAASELDSDGRINKKRFVMALAFSAASGLLILGLLLWCTTHMKQRSETGEDLLHFDLNVSLSASREEQSEVNMMKANKTKLEIPLFSFSSVSAATNNFSPSNKLGEGGFGPVYKGILLNGQEVAIKRLSKRSTQGRDEWKNEAVLIAKLQHKNLVKLLGCCIEGDENLLVYEYLPNKSLDNLLFDSAKDSILDWATRVRIIEGIAQGLLYLHQYSRLTIIHRDLKVSNILLDKDMNPKISDFGMARIFGGNQRGATRRIVGTYGYMAPEYALEGIFSVKSDVFSFGILLLEILSAKRNNSFYHNDFLNGRNDFLNLIGYAWDLWTRGKPLELKDPNLQETPCANIDSLLTRYIHVALLCVQQHPVERPKMSEVVLMFSNEQYSLPTPKPPAFSLLRSLVDPASQKTEADDCSANFGTTSVVEAR